MKNKFILMLLMALPLGLVFTACSDDEEEDAPASGTISFISDPAHDDNVVEAAPGESIEIIMRFRRGDYRPEGFEVFSRIGETGQENSIATGDLADEADQTVTFDYEVPMDANDGDRINLRFEVSQRNASNVSRSFVVQVSGEAETVAINAYTAKLLGGQNNASNGSFFSTQNGEIYTVAQARDNQSMIDFIYYYGSTNQATIAGPTDDGAEQYSVFGLADWNTRNATEFKTVDVTPEAFIAIGDEEGAQINAAIAAGSDKDPITRARQLSVDNVFGFVTAGGKEGLVHVAEIEEGGDGSITINVKVVE